MTCKCFTESIEETIELGKSIGECLNKGAIVILEGTLGCGKTVLAKGIAMSLGISEDEVSSPSFTIVHEYDRLIHIDLYRIDRKSLHDIGMEELLDDTERIKVIEWMKGFEDIENLGFQVLKINCRFKSENERVFEIDDKTGNICKKLKTSGRLRCQE